MKIRFPPYVFTGKLSLNLSSLASVILITTRVVSNLPFSFVIVVQCHQCRISNHRPNLLPRSRVNERIFTRPFDALRCEPVCSTVCMSITMEDLAQFDSRQISSLSEWQKTWNLPPAGHWRLIFVLHKPVQSFIYKWLSLWIFDSSEISHRMTPKRKEVARKLALSLCWPDVELSNHAIHYECLNFRLTTAILHFGSRSMSVKRCFTISWSAVAFGLFTLLI